MKFNTDPKWLERRADQEDRHFISVGGLTSTTPGWTMQATPLYEGSGVVNIYDCSIWWAGNPAPTAYPAFSVSDVLSNTMYALFVEDAGHAGSGASYGAVQSAEFSAIPVGAVVVALVKFSF